MSDWISFLMSVFCVIGIDAKLGHGLMRCRSEFSFLVIVFCLFGVIVKLRPGLMRCRSEVSFIVFVFLFFWSRCESETSIHAMWEWSFIFRVSIVLFGVDVKFTHGLMRCRSEFHLLCLLFCLSGVGVKLGDGLMRCRLELCFLASWLECYPCQKRRWRSCSIFGKAWQVKLDDQVRERC